MKVYTLTRILKNKEGDIWLNDVIDVYSNIEDAKAFAEDAMKRIEALNDGKVNVTHRHESKGVESIEATYKTIYDLSSEMYRIKEFEVK